MIKARVPGNATQSVVGRTKGPNGDTDATKSGRLILRFKVGSI